VLEHVNPELGRRYLEEIARRSGFHPDWKEFRRNDERGGARLVEYDGAGSISPSTVRYVKVLADLQTHFGDLDGLSMCEIGVGYGGQCRIVHAGAAPAEYWLVDLEPVQMLARRYLDGYVLRGTLRYRTMNELEVRRWDLVVSNYAFSELPREVQEVYMDKVLLRCARGYLTMNELTPPEFRSFTREEMLARIPGSRALDEVPFIDDANYILVWGPNAGQPTAPGPSSTAVA
jgi:putative sugar O-methyltransferase